ncbi:MAG: 4Fe-4S dicluster domain-containing protein [Bacteroidales bacterium]|nr:4Fe-4S dicluster domain-containing protein [Bacteroidales bacterium]MBO7478923.1 4Fe-4S dicluster domain-containing protein [Bacteroidales bacterium]MBO7488379.1 4Fe-4S dicluster domain-containing protein [Bacteroidales bacterium]
MIDFGYTLSKSGTLRIDTLDDSRFKALHKLEPDAYKCIGCGSCTASCSAGVFTELSLRKILLSMQRGDEKQYLNQLQSCMLCGKCMMVCPRGINTRHLILSICKICSIEK